MEFSDNRVGASQDHLDSSSNGSKEFFTPKEEEESCLLLCYSEIFFSTMEEKLVITDSGFPILYKNVFTKIKGVHIRRHLSIA